MTADDRYDGIRGSIARLFGRKPALSKNPMALHLFCCIAVNKRFSFSSYSAASKKHLPLSRHSSIKTYSEREKQKPIIITCMHMMNIYYNAAAVLFLLFFFSVFSIYQYQVLGSYARMKKRSIWFGAPKRKENAITMACLPRARKMRTAKEEETLRRKEGRKKEERGKRKKRKCVREKAACSNVYKCRFLSCLFNRGLM